MQKLAYGEHQLNNMTQKVLLQELLTLCAYNVVHCIAMNSSDIFPSCLLEGRGSKN